MLPFTIVWSVFLLFSEAGQSHYCDHREVYDQTRCTTKACL